MNLITFYNTNLLLFLYLQFLLFIVLFCINFRRILNEFKGIDKRYFAYVFIIIVVLLSVYFMHLDKLSPGKTFVLTAARSFSEERTDLFFINEGTPSGLTEGRDPYPWGPFHPFILGLFFKFLGPDMNVIYFFYSGVAALSVIVLFLVGYYLFRNENFGIVIAFCYLLVYLVGFLDMFIAEHADFLILFASLSLFFMFISYKLNNTYMYALAMLTILLTIEIRFEIAVLFPVFLVGIFVYRFDKVKKTGFWLRKILPGLLIIILLSPVFFIHAASHHFPPGSSDIVGRFSAPLPMLSGSFLTPDSGERFVMGFVHFWMYMIPIIFSIFAFIGVVLMFKKYKRVALLLSLLFITNNIIFFLWNNGYQPRYAFTTVTAFIIFMGFGMSFIPRLLKTRWRRASLIGIVIFLILVFNIYYGENITRLSSVKSFDIIEGFESDLNPLLQETENKQVNFVTIGDDYFQNIVEFLVLKKTANIFAYITDTYFMYEKDRILNEEGVSHQSIADNWRYELEPDFRSYVDGVYDRAIKATIDLITKNETIRESIRNIFLVNVTDTYFITQNFNKEEKVYKMVFQSTQGIFNLEQVYIGKYIEVYREI